MPTKFLGVVARGCAVVAVAALALVGCDRGDTAGVTHLTDISATLHGTINSSEPATQTWFEYDTHPEIIDGVLVFDRSTAEQQPPCCDLEVSAPVAGLAPNSTYHYRFCIRTGSGSGLCGAPDSFTTRPADRDMVEGTIVSLDAWSGESVWVSLRAEPDSSVPVGQAAHVIAGRIVVFREGGQVTCLRISGNRAAVGFVADVPPGSAVVPRLIFIEDNGPTGDRFAYAVAPETPTTCPDPAAHADAWRVATEGDATITDHLPLG